MKRLLASLVLLALATQAHALIPLKLRTPSAVSIDFTAGSIPATVTSARSGGTTLQLQQSATTTSAFTGTSACECRGGNWGCGCWTFPAITQQVAGSTNDLNNGSFSQQGTCTVTSNYSVAPDGTSTSSRLLATGGASTCIKYQTIGTSPNPAFGSIWIRDDATTPPSLAGSSAIAWSDTNHEQGLPGGTGNAWRRLAFGTLTETYYTVYASGVSPLFNYNVNPAFDTTRTGGINAWGLSAVSQGADLPLAPAGSAASTMQLTSTAYSRFLWNSRQDQDVTACFMSAFWDTRYQNSGGNDFWLWQDSNGSGVRYQHSNGTSELDAWIGATGGVDRYAVVQALAWQATHVYAAGATATNDIGKSYIVTTGGTSAGAGGPTGTGQAITDNTVTWRYQGLTGGMGLGAYGTETCVRYWWRTSTNQGGLAVTHGGGLQATSGVVSGQTSGGALAALTSFYIGSTTGLATIAPVMWTHVYSNPLPPPATYSEKILLLGDSLSASYNVNLYSSRPMLANVIATPAQQTRTATPVVVSLAHQSDTLANQKSAFDASPYRLGAPPCVLIGPLGVNDINGGASELTVSGSYQTLVNDIAATIPGAKIIASYLTPASGYFGGAKETILEQLNSDLGGTGLHNITGLTATIPAVFNNMNNAGALIAKCDTAGNVNDHLHFDGYCVPNITGPAAAAVVSAQGCLN